MKIFQNRKKAKEKDNAMGESMNTKKDVTKVPEEKSKHKAIKLDAKDSRLDRSPHVSKIITGNSPMITTPAPQKTAPVASTVTNTIGTKAPTPQLQTAPKTAAQVVVENGSQQLPEGSQESSISRHLTSLTDLREQAAKCVVTRELVKKFIADIWNRGELDLICEVCHPDLRFNGYTGMDKVGHDGFGRMVTTIREALNNYHCEIHSMVVEGNKAFARMRFTGQHTGMLLGYSPTNRQVAWMGAIEFTCKDGKILKVWELGDVKSLEEQLRGA